MIVNCTDGALEYNAAINIHKTLTCGQMFRWDGKTVTAGYGAGERKLTLSQDGHGNISVSASTGEFSAFWENYFDLSADYGKLAQCTDGDAFFAKCLEYGSGIHILRQDAWETLISFILSQNSNIPRITSCIGSLVGIFGHFPTPEEISKADLARVRCGYRLPYLKAASVSEAIYSLCDVPYEDAKAALKRIKGVGDKVADCVILFGLHNRWAFPVDVWIRRVIDVKYSGKLNPSKYGCMAGLVQQYMFYYAINHREEFT